MKTARDGQFLVLLLGAGHLLAQADRNLFAVAAPAASRALGLGDTATGLALGTGFALAFGLFAVPFGLLADRGWRRLLLVAGAVAWTAGSMATGAAGSLAALVAARIVIGLGQAAFVPAALALLVDAPVERRAGRLAAFTVGSTLGRGGALIGGGAILALLVAAGLSWRWLFLLTSLPNLLLIAMLFGGSSRERAVATAPLSLARWPMLLAYLLVAAGPIVVGQALIAWLPTLMERAHGLSAGRAGIVLGVTTLLAAPAAQLLGGWLGRRWRAMHAAPVAVIVALLWLSVPVVLWVARAPTAAAVVAGLIAATFTLGIASFAALFGWQAITPASARGTANGIFMAAVTLFGTGTGPLLTGVLSQLGTKGLGEALLSTAFVTALVASGTALLYVAACRWSQRRATSPA